jgi:hypothetical protein
MMMTTRIKMLRGTCLGDGRDAYPGDIVEVGDAQAALLIAQGRARAAGSTPLAAPPVPPMPPVTVASDEPAEPKRKVKRNG